MNFTIVKLEEVKDQYPWAKVKDATCFYTLKKNGRVITDPEPERPATIIFEVPKKLPAGEKGVFWPFTMSKVLDEVEEAYEATQQPYGNEYVRRTAKAILGKSWHQYKSCLVPGEFRFEGDTFIFRAVINPQSAGASQFLFLTEGGTRGYLPESLAITKIFFDGDESEISGVILPFDILYRPGSVFVGQNIFQIRANMNTNLKEYVNPFRD